MKIQPYDFEELCFAWCYRVYFRWQTFRRTALPILHQLDGQHLSELLDSYGVRLLEYSTSSTEVRMLVSLAPSESVSAAASKVKGRLSHWLTERSPRPRRLFSRGYFAASAGQSSADAIDGYLQRQGEHHGYTRRRNPPVLVRRFAVTSDAVDLLRTDHAVTKLRFHIVLATWYRRGIFVPELAEQVTHHWKSLERSHLFFVEKVSFVPDHVHLAIRLHPKIAPGQLIVVMMNAAQELIWTRHSTQVLRAGVERLWQPSAYLGSFGDLTTNAISSYIRSR